MSDYYDWVQDGVENDWIMPIAPWYARLPLVRHIRTILLKIAVHRHYTQGIGSIGLRTGYDEWVLYGIWHGLEIGKQDE